MLCLGHSVCATRYKEMVVVLIYRRMGLFLEAQRLMNVAGVAGVHHRMGCPFEVSLPFPRC